MYGIVDDKPFRRGFDDALVEEYALASHDGDDDDNRRVSRENSTTTTWCVPVCVCCYSECSRATEVDRGPVAFSAATLIPSFALL